MRDPAAKESHDQKAAVRGDSASTHQWMAATHPRPRGASGSRGGARRSMAEGAKEVRVSWAMYGNKGQLEAQSQNSITLQRYSHKDGAGFSAVKLSRIIMKMMKRTNRDLETRRYQQATPIMSPSRKGICPIPTYQTHTTSASEACCHGHLSNQLISAPCEVWDHFWAVKFCQGNKLTNWLLKKISFPQPPVHQCYCQMCLAIFNPLWAPASSGWELQGSITLQTAWFLLSNTLHQQTLQNSRSVYIVNLH